VTDILDTRTSRGLADLWAGLKIYEAWSTMAWHDIRKRYRRSLIGPFWITLSMGATVLGIAIVFSGLFGTPFAELVPYLAVGISVWALVVAMTSEVSTVFNDSASMSKNMSWPYSFFIFKHFAQQLIIFGHNILAGLLVVLISGKMSFVGLLVAVPGLLLAILNCGWIGIVVAVVGARYRDVQLAMANILQVFFFLTPIIWRVENLQDHQFIIYINPFYYIVTLVRDPILSQIPPLSVWLVGIAMAVAGWSVAVALYNEKHQRLSYWV
jgi:ABC-type polysaccharide/polyol phosphate export permease